MSHSLNLAQRHAFDLARTLMTPVILFRAEDGAYGVMPASEYDGEDETVLHEFDPWVPA